MVVERWKMCLKMSCCTSDVELMKMTEVDWRSHDLIGSGTHMNSHRTDQPFTVASLKSPHIRLNTTHNPFSPIIQCALQRAKGRTGSTFQQ